MTKGVVVCLVLLLALGAMGVGYAQWSDEVIVISTTHRSANFDDPFSWVVSNDDGVSDEAIDPGDDGSDPSEPQAVGEPCNRHDKDVASTTVELVDPFNISVTLSNAYPCYYATIFYGLENLGSVPAKVASIEVDENALTPDVLEDIPELTVTVTGIYACQTEIDPGQEVTGDLEIHVEQDAMECHTYFIKIKVVVDLWCAVGGTPGYWQNWDQHYDVDQVNEWLGYIDAKSDWLVDDMDGNGLIDTDDMDAIRDAATGKGSTMEDRFLSQYLSTRLNVEAGRLAPEASHDVTGSDPGNYLGLANPESAKLSEIIDAIELKYGTSPDKDQFEIMKDICVDLNEVNI